MFHKLYYSLAPCLLLLAPYETEQAELAKVELIIDGAKIMQKRPARQIFSANRSLSSMNYTKRTVPFVYINTYFLLFHK